MPPSFGDNALILRCRGIDNAWVMPSSFVAEAWIMHGECMDHAWIVYGKYTKKPSYISRFLISLFPYYTFSERLFYQQPDHSTYYDIVFARDLILCFSASE